MSDSEKEGDKKITQLPLARIKRLMKTVPTEMGNLSTESVVLITRATELFLEHFAEQGAKNITSGKGTLKYEDLGKYSSWQDLHIPCA